MIKANKKLSLRILFLVGLLLVEKINYCSVHAFAALNKKPYIDSLLKTNDINEVNLFIESLQSEKDCKEVMSILSEQLIKPKINGKKLLLNAYMTDRLIFRYNYITFARSSSINSSDEHLIAANLLISLRSDGHLKNFNCLE